MKRIKPALTLCLSLTLLFLVAGCAERPASLNSAIIPAPAVGEQLPGITLTTPEDRLIRTYLGLAEGDNESFNLGEIECDFLLIEIFSMYCPYCQREAPSINELYNLIQNDRALSQQIKMIGIGVGNSTFEVGVFKKKYSVEFPLFADRDFSIHKKLGNVRTPYFIAIYNRGEIKNQVFMAKLGGLEGAEDFLHFILELAETNMKEKK